jgi:hypothetical protein
MFSNVLSFLEIYRAREPMEKISKIDWAVQHVPVPFLPLPKNTSDID